MFYRFVPRIFGGSQGILIGIILPLMLYLSCYFLHNPSDSNLVAKPTRLLKPYQYRAIHFMRSHQDEKRTDVLS